MRGAFDMAGQDVSDRAPSLHGGIERVDRGAGHPEGDLDTFLLHDADSRIDGAHLGHMQFPSR
jgi:hypothetical protein